MQHPKMSVTYRISTIRQRSIRGFSTSSSSAALTSPDPSLVDGRNAPTDYTADCAVVYQHVLTQEEGELLAQDILSRMKRRRYEKGHWDAVITQYKEVELPDSLFEKPEISNIINRVRKHLEKCHLTYEPIQWLSCHAIDLKKEGELNAHVDSVKFSGDLVAGISLLSPSIMRLIPDDGTATDTSSVSEEDGWIDLYLPPLSLYALTGVGRYRYSHQLLPHNAVFTRPDGTEITVERDHRLSVIFRDSKPN